MDTQQMRLLIFVIAVTLGILATLGIRRRAIQRIEQLDDYWIQAIGVQGARLIYPFVGVLSWLGFVFGLPVVFPALNDSTAWFAAIMVAFAGFPVTLAYSALRLASMSIVTARLRRKQTVSG